MTTFRSLVALGCLLLSLAAAAADPAAAAGPARLPKIAVLSVHAEQGVSQGSANLLLEILTSDIQQSGKYQVLSGSDIAAMLGYERQKQLVGCTEESCLAEVGSALGADLLLDVSVGTIGNLRVLALKLLDVKAGVVKRRETETLPDDNALIDGGHRLVARLLDLKLPEAGHSARRGVGIGLVAGGVGFLATGIVFGVIANGQLNNYRQSADPNAAGSARDAAHIADGAYGAALVAGVVGAILFFTGGSSGGGSR